MPRRYSSTEIVTGLKRAGFEPASQEGSHLKLRRVAAGVTNTVIVKHPARETPAGTFSSILRQAGLSRSEFEDLLS